MVECTQAPARKSVWRRDVLSAVPSRANPQALRTWYMSVKTLAEFLLALAIGIVAFPVMALAALLVKLTSRGPALYSQTRVGLAGRPFTIYKLRSMAHDCEKASGPQWSTRTDPRVTPLGRFLRRSHIDELPQLWNVLRGDMSLIGPRPERPEFVVQLESALPGYSGRLRVRPGVSGLAQVQLPPDVDLASVRRKLERDLYYVRHLSPWLDLRILFCTGLKVLGVPFRMLSLFLPQGRAGAELTSPFRLRPFSPRLALETVSRQTGLKQAAA